MVKVNQTEFNQAAENHEKWLTGSGGARLTFIDADLSNIIISSKQLPRNLTKATFTGCKLSDCTLEYGNFSYAKFGGAVLSGCSLRASSFFGARLLSTTIVDCLVDSALFFKFWSPRFSIYTINGFFAFYLPKNVNSGLKRLLSLFKNSNKFYLGITGAHFYGKT